MWENFAETMRNFARWKAWLRDNADLITQVYTTEDIARAKREDKTGIILGWQNSQRHRGPHRVPAPCSMSSACASSSSPTTPRTWVGSGCYEFRDSGLSDFGRDVLAEMNRLGILCDLSHVGPKTSEDAILASKQRVAYSHCLPAGLKAHPRNKSDEQLSFIADRNGFVGVTMFPAFLKRGTAATVDDYVEAIEYVINLCRRGLRRHRHRLHARATATSSSAGSPTTRAGAASSSTSGRSSTPRACAGSATSPT